MIIVMKPFSIITATADTQPSSSRGRTLVFSFCLNKQSESSNTEASQRSNLGVFSLMTRFLPDC